MNVTVIPFFLAASIGVDVNDWKYGPEVIYDARINHFQDIGLITSSNITAKLKCRPKSESVLSCGFTEPNLLINLEKLWSASRDLLMGLKDNFENVENRFELNYGINGLESIVGSSKGKQKIELMRYLANELNVPESFFYLSSNNVDVMENSISGLCKTNYTVTAVNADDDDNDDNDEDVYEDAVKPYNFTMIIDNKFPPGEIKKILRTRNLNECSKHASNLISTNGIIMEKNTTSSRSLMTLTTKGFTSWTENTIFSRIKQIFGMPAARISKMFDVTVIHKEIITLTLDKIVPANQPLPTIEEPVTVGIFSV